jgi:hypothetical protein
MSDAEFQTEVARVALGVAASHGFALGGGQALVAMGIVDRPTEDVDLFTAAEHAVPAAAGEVRATLEAAGYQVTEVAGQDELAALFDGFELEYVEWEVRRGGLQTELTLAHLPRRQDPVRLAIGPVLHLDDLLGSKVAATAARAQPRDFIDLAGATARLSVAELIVMGRRYDPGLQDEDFEAAGLQLDRMSDARFAPYGLDTAAVAQVRARLKEWPRPR